MTVTGELSLTGLMQRERGMEFFLSFVECVFFCGVVFGVVLVFELCVLQ